VYSDRLCQQGSEELQSHWYRGPTGKSPYITVANSTAISPRSGRSTATSIRADAEILSSLFGLGTPSLRNLAGEIAQLRTGLSEFEYSLKQTRQLTLRQRIGTPKSPSVLVSRRRTAVPVVRPEGRLPGVIAIILRNRLSMSALGLKLRIQKSSGSVKKKRKLLTHKR